MGTLALLWFACGAAAALCAAAGVTWGAASSVAAGRRRAVLTGVLALVVPGAWLGLGEIGPWILRAQPGVTGLLLTGLCSFGLHSLGAGLGVYVETLLRQGDDEVGKVERIRQLAHRPLGRRLADGLAPARVPPTGGRGASERQRLLDALADGGDPRCQAAARALSLSLAGSRDRDAALRLLDVLFDEKRGAPARSEAYLALRQVMEEAIPWEREVEVRQRFPDGVDWDWARGVEGAMARASD